MREEGYIGFGQGFESEVFPTLIQPAGTTTLITPVTGWEWWSLATARFLLNNTGGAVTAGAFVSVQYGNIIVFTGGPSLVAVAGASQIASFGMLCSGTTGVSLAVVASLPFAPVIGEGAVIFGFSGGDGATVIGNGNFIIIGKRRRNKAK